MLKRYQTILLSLLVLPVGVVGAQGYNNSGTPLIQVNVGVGTQSTTTATSSNTRTSGDTSAAVDISTMMSSSLFTEGQSLNIDRSEVEADGEAFANVEPQSVEVNADLRAYAQSAIKSDSGIEEMNFTKDTVEVKYKQRGKLFALIPITFIVTTTAHADGTVEVDYPWYSFLTSDQSNEVEAEIQAMVSNTIDADVETGFSASNSARVASAIQSVLKTRLESETEVDYSLD